MKKRIVTVLLLVVTLTIMVTGIASAAYDFCSYCGSEGPVWCQGDCIGTTSCYGGCGREACVSTQHFYCSNSMCGASYYWGDHPCVCGICGASCGY